MLAVDTAAVWPRVLPGKPTENTALPPLFVPATTKSDHVSHTMTPCGVVYDTAANMPLVFFAQVARYAAESAKGEVEFVLSTWV
jgi:hypothetical protein